MEDTKKDRGYYNPRSYRFSKETTDLFKKLAIEHGSQEKAMKHLIKNYK